MIGCKGPFDAIEGKPALGKDAARIIDEDVDLGETLTDLVGKRPNGLLGRHVREQERGRGPRCNLRYLRPGVCTALVIATDHQHARAHLREFTRGDKADAAIGAGNEHCFSVHGARPRRGALDHEHIDEVAVRVPEQHRAVAPGLIGRRLDPLADAFPQADVMRIDVLDLEIKDKRSIGAGCENALPVELRSRVLVMARPEQGLCWNST